MKKTRKVLALVLVFSMLLSIGALAVSDVTGQSEDSPYEFMQYSDVEEYISHAKSLETVKVCGQDATYYYGDGYIVAQEAHGYSLIMTDEVGASMTLNGVAVDFSIATISSVFPRLSLNRSSDWTYFDTFQFDLDISFMTAVMARAALIGAGVSPDAADAIMTLIEGLIVNQYFPDGLFISYREMRYFEEIDPWTQLVEWKYVQDLWHGDQNNPRSHPIDTWTTITYR